MIDILKVLLSLTLSGTILTLILFAIKPLYKNKLSKIWQYYIWIIVIARLLIPFTPDVSLVGSVFYYFDNEIQNLLATTEASNIDNEAIGNFTENGIAPNENKETTSTDKKSIASINKINTYRGILNNLWIVSAVISLILLIRKITIYQSFVRFVKAGRAEVSDIEILNMLADVEETIGVKRPVELFTNPLISSPMLLGFFRPYIILPSAAVDSTELAYIIQHELTHYKRLDMFYKWLVQITVCLHWFNPFAYLLAKEINKCCELSCDEAIIKTLGKDEIKAYGDTLLNSLKTIGHYNDKLAAVTLAEGAKQLKERLDAIMNFKKKNKVVIATTLMLTAMLCIGSTAIGAYAAAPTTDTSSSVMGGIEQSYTYSQTVYYQEPYIFEIGWNLKSKWYETYLDKAEIILSDLSTITVSFDKSCKAEVENQEVLSSLTKLIDRIKVNETTSDLPLEKPLIVSVEYIGNMESMNNSELNALATDYYKNGQLSNFSAIFSALNTKNQKKYLSMFYENDDITFFSGSLENINSKLINIYADKSYQENNINYFSVIVPHLTDNAKQIYGEKAYKDGNINYFSIIVPYLTDEQKQTWVIRASHDNENNFLSLLE